MNNTIERLGASLPFRKQFQSLKRAIVPYTSDPRNDLRLLKHAAVMAETLGQTGILQGATVVEIGTGWVPILPLIFRCAGAGEVITVDHDRLLDKHTFKHAITFIRENLDRAAKSSATPRELFDLARLPSRSEPSLNDLCRVSGIDYRAPFDFRQLGEDVAEFVVSRFALEHVPEDLVREMFRHALSVTKPGGIMCHIIDLSDHLEHSDKSISRIDMLRYSDQEWGARTRHRLNHLSRLRRFEYQRLLEETGWEVVCAIGSPDRQSLEALKTMTITPKYAAVPHSELAILETMVVGRRPG
jgi:hypothetical protein